MKYLTSVFAFVLAFGSVLEAAEVPPETASAAVQAWRSRGNRFRDALRGHVQSARRVEQGKAKFNVVSFSEGGFVITSADTKRRPIVFVSDGGDYDETATDHPLYALLQRDLRGEAEVSPAFKTASCELPFKTASCELPSEPGAEAAWTDLLENAYDSTPPQDEGDVTDIRVAPLITTKWSQSGGVYNYYTPYAPHGTPAGAKGYSSGCVATSLAQVMRYFRWPDSSYSVEQWVNAYNRTNGVYATYTMLGGTYDWDNMVDTPSANIELQAQAVGKLCYDCGVAVSMNWTTNGSSTTTTPQRHALTHRFNYSNAILQYPGSGVFFTGHEKNARDALLSNFDNGRPVTITAPGHAFNFDGYAYTTAGDLCYHVNFGWGGYMNGWYIPPYMADYSSFNHITYNIFTTEPTGYSIASGRVLDAEGAPIADIPVSFYSVVDDVRTLVAQTNSNEKGIWSFIAAPGNYVATAGTKGYTYGETGAITLSTNISATLVYDDGRTDYSVTPAPAVGNSAENDFRIDGWLPIDEMTNLGGETLEAGGAWDQIFGNGGGISNGTLNVDINDGWWRMYGTGFTIGNGGKLVTKEYTSSNGEVNFGQGASLTIDGGEFVYNNNRNPSSNGFYLGDSGTAPDNYAVMSILNGGIFTSTYQFMRVGTKAGQTGYLSVDDGTINLPANQELRLGVAGGAAVVGLTNATVSAQGIRLSESSSSTVKLSMSNTVLNVQRVSKSNNPVKGSYIKLDDVTFNTLADDPDPVLLTEVRIPYTLEAGGITVNATNDAALTCTFDGTGPLNKIGDAKLTFQGGQKNGKQDYGIFGSTGAVNVNEGTLYLTNNPTFNSSTVINVAAGATLAIAPGSADNSLPSGYEKVRVKGIIDLGGTTQTVSSRVDGNGFLQDGAELRNGKVILNPSTDAWCKFTDSTITLGPGGYLYLPANSDKRGQLNLNGAHLIINGGTFEDLNSRNGGYIGNLDDGIVEISNGGKFLYQNQDVYLGYSNDADAKKGTIICNDGTVDLGAKILYFGYGTRGGISALAMTNSTLTCKEVSLGYSTNNIVGMQTLSFKDSELNVQKFTKKALNADSSIVFDGAVVTTAAKDKNVLGAIDIPYQLAGNGVTVNAVQSGNSVSGVFEGTGPFAKSGPQTLTFAGTYSSTGPIEVREGRLAVTAAAKLNPGTVIKVADEAIIELVGNSEGAFSTTNASLRIDSETSGKAHVFISSALTAGETYTIFGNVREEDLARIDFGGLNVTLDNGTVKVSIPEGDGGNRIWDNGASDNLWSSAANWNNDAAPGSTDNVVFNTSGNHETDYDLSGIPLGTMFVSNGTWTVDLHGAKLNVSKIDIAKGKGLYLVNPCAVNPLPEDNSCAEIRGGTLDLGGATQTFPSQFTWTLKSGTTLRNGTFNMISNQKIAERPYSLTLDAGAIVNSAARIIPNKTDKDTNKPRGDVTVYVKNGSALTLGNANPNRLGMYKNDWTSVYVLTNSSLNIPHDVWIGWDTNGRGRLHVKNGSSAVVNGMMKIAGRDAGEATGSADVQVLDGSLLQVDGDIGYGYYTASGTENQNIIITGSTLKTKRIVHGDNNYGSHRIRFDFNNAVFVPNTANVNLFDDTKSAYANEMFRITGGTLTISNTVGKVTIGSVVSGAGGFTLTGGKDLEFTKKPTYTGTTTVAAGTLFYNYDSLPSLTVMKGGTFAYSTNLTITGAVDLQSGATLTMPVELVDSAWQSPLLTVNDAVSVAGVNFAVQDGPDDWTDIEVPVLTATEITGKPSVPEGQGYAIRDNGNGTHTLLITGNTMTPEEEKPYFAVYTGAGEDPKDLTDPENWICYNANEEVVEGAVPLYYTTVRLGGETSFSYSASDAESMVIGSLVLTTNVTLAGDCDWSGFATLTASGNYVINLDGNRLEAYIPSNSPVKVVGEGTMVIDVPADTVYSTEAIFVEASCGFVKKGAGELKIRATNIDVDNNRCRSLELTAGKVTLVNDTDYELANYFATNMTAIAGTLDLGGTTQTFSEDPDDIFNDGAKIIDGDLLLTSTAAWDAAGKTITFGTNLVMTCAAMLNDKQKPGNSRLVFEKGCVCEFTRTDDQRLGNYQDDGKSGHYYLDIKSGAMVTVNSRFRIACGTRGKSTVTVDGGTLIVNGKIQVADRDSGGENGKGTFTVKNGSRVECNTLTFCEADKEWGNAVVSISGSTIRTSQFYFVHTGKNNSASLSFNNAVIEVRSVVDYGLFRNIEPSISGGTLTIDNTYDGTTIANNVTGKGGLVITGGGTVTFTVAPTYTGATTVTDGTLDFLRTDVVDEVETLVHGGLTHGSKTLTVGANGTYLADVNDNTWTTLTFEQGSTVSCGTKETINLTATTINGCPGTDKKHRAKVFNEETPYLQLIYGSPTLIMLR